MNMKQITLREGARRQHRTIAVFAVIQCWLRNLDGIAFQRPQLERLLGLDRFKRTRVDWLKEDLREFFPHVKIYRYAGKEYSLASVIVARVEIKSHLPKGTMTTEQRIKGVTKDGPSLGLFELWALPTLAQQIKPFEGLMPFFADAANYDERFLSSYLSLLVQGQISPHSLPPLKPMKE